MTYIDRINSFWDLVGTNPLSTGQVSLYFALLHINNKSNWAEWFTVPNQVLSILTGLSRSGILRARNELKQRGLIDIQERGKKATAYKLNFVVEAKNRNYTLNCKQDSVQDCKQDSVQDCKQDCKQDCNTLKDKDIDKDTISCSPASEPDEREVNFGKIYEEYPKKRGKEKAYEYYLGWLKGRTINGRKKKLDNRQMYVAVLNYVEQCEEEGLELRFYKNFDTFMNKSILDYLEEEHGK